MIYPYYPYYPVYIEPLYEVTATEIEMEKLKADRDRAIADEVRKLERCIAAAQNVIAKAQGAPAVVRASEKAISECREKYERVARDIEARYEIAFAELRKRLLLGRARIY